MDYEKTWNVGRPSLLFLKNKHKNKIHNLLGKKIIVIINEQNPRNENTVLSAQLKPRQLNLVAYLGKLCEIEHQENTDDGLHV